MEFVVLGIILGIFGIFMNYLAYQILENYLSNKLLTICWFTMFVPFLTVVLSIIYLIFCAVFLLFLPFFEIRPWRK